MSNKAICSISILIIVVILGVLSFGCNSGGTGNSEYYINGTIDGTPYNREGITIGAVAFGWTQISAADSQSDIDSTQNYWQLAVLGTTTGTYNSIMDTVVYIIDSSTLYSGQGSDITIVITSLGDVIEGTFEGTVTHSVALTTHSVSGSFRVQKVF
jgi:hypothetical protein